MPHELHQGTSGSQPCSHAGAALEGMLCFHCCQNFWWELPLQQWLRAWWDRANPRCVCIRNVLRLCLGSLGSLKSCKHSEFRAWGFGVVPRESFLRENRIILQGRILVLQQHMEAITSKMFGINSPAADKQQGTAWSGCMALSLSWTPLVFKNKLFGFCTTSESRERSCFRGNGFPCRAGRAAGGRAASGEEEGVEG